MADQVDLNVDLERVLERLKRNFATKMADLEQQNAMLHVALEDALAAQAEAEEDNRRLREEAIRST